MDLKTKIATMSRKTLVLTAAAALTVGAVSGVAATAYSRQTPLVTTAIDLASALIGRSTSAARPADAASQTAQSVTPALPVTSEPVPGQTPAPTTAPEIPGPIPQTVEVPVAPGQIQQSPVRTAITQETTAQPATSTPGAGPGPGPAPTFAPTSPGPAPSFIPTSSSVRPGAMPIPGRSVRVIRRAAPEICN